MRAGHARNQRHLAGDGIGGLMIAPYIQLALVFTGLQAKLEPQYGGDTQQIVATYRNAMPNASAPELLSPLPPLP